MKADPAAQTPPPTSTVVYTPTPILLKNLLVDPLRLEFFRQCQLTIQPVRLQLDQSLGSAGGAVGNSFITVVAAIPDLVSVGLDAMGTYIPGLKS